MYELIKTLFVQNILYMYMIINLTQFIYKNVNTFCISTMLPKENHLFIMALLQLG